VQTGQGLALAGHVVELAALLRPLDLLVDDRPVAHPVPAHRPDGTSGAAERAAKKENRSVRGDLIRNQL
jgi:hypothetical protein